MNKIYLKPLCKNIEKKEIKETVKVFKVICNDDSVFVTERGILKEKFKMLEITDILTDRLYIIPVHSLKLIEEMKLVTVYYKCGFLQNDFKKRQGFLCKYLIPEKYDYGFDPLGIEPVQWNSFDIEEKE